MTKHIGIGFVTGRKHFKKVLRTYINNWLESGLISDPDVRIHLFIAYDLMYQNTRKKDYKNIDGSLKEMIDSITFISEKAVLREMHELAANHGVTAAESDLIFGEGYAKKRNAVLYFAMKQKMDKLIFLDDDEYPLAVLRDGENRVSWTGQGIVGTHLKYNDDADITHGHHCGYISPLPHVAFSDSFTEDTFRRFIEAISNDIISWKAVRENIILNHGITYADPQVVKHGQPKEVREKRGMKFISGANLCFNLARKGKIPPFFNPPGARGEDTFMSTCLSDLKVVKVPCYAFHDGFGMYNHLLHGVLPVQFQPTATDSEAIRNRFIRATIGWIRYKPLLVYISDRKRYEETIRKMRADLEASVPVLCRYFSTIEFNRLFEELEYYHRNVKKHFASFERTKKAWEKITASIASTVAPLQISAGATLSPTPAGPGPLRKTYLSRTKD